MTFESPNDSPRITFRCSTAMDERLANYAEKNSMSKSEVVRSALRTYIGRPDADSNNESHIVPPGDETLHTAWKALKDGSNRNGWIREDMALTLTAVDTQIPKQAVQAKVLQELEERGYIHRTTDLYGRNASYRVLQ